MSSYQGLFGIIAFLGIAWAMSKEKNQIKLADVMVGVGLQFLLAWFIFHVAALRQVFWWLTKGVEALQRALNAGTSFVFGYLGGGGNPFVVQEGASAYIFAFQSLPFIVFISALSSLLFYLKILPFFIRIFSVLFEKTLRIGGALSFGAASNIFLGMDTAPLTIKPHLRKMSQSELFALMASGMATVSGTVMVLYASVLGGISSDMIGHIIAASIMSVPAALTIARIMMPDTQGPTPGTYSNAHQPKSMMDAISRGASDGLSVMLNVAVMLIVLIALVSLLNELLGLISLRGEPLTLQAIFGVLLMPVMWLMGVPLEDAHLAGSLVGTKVVLNELIAYIQLSRLPEGVFSARTELMMVYALCGFANFGSVGILLGVLNTLIPERRNEIVGLGIKAMFAGLLASLTTGALAGLFL